MKKNKNIVKTITLRDVARRARCSVNTASLALRNSPRISDERRREIQEIANKLGYIPNHAARNLRSKRTKMIGIYTRQLNDAVRMQMVNTLLGELHLAGYRPLLGISTEKGQWYQSPWMQTFREMRVETIVVLWENPLTLPDWSKKIPTIFIGCSPNESLKCDYLALDRYEAGRIGTEHLIERGYKKIFIAAPLDSSFSKGSLKAIKQADVQRYNLAYSAKDITQFYSLGYTISKQHNPPDAVICGDSQAAARFMQGVLEAGKKVPNDIAIVGYDYFPWADILAVPLTTIEQPLDIMASTAISLIKHRLEERNAPNIHLVQPHKLIIRLSS